MSSPCVPVEKAKIHLFQVHTSGEFLILGGSETACDSLEILNTNIGKETWWMLCQYLLKAKTLRYRGTFSMSCWNHYVYK